MGDYYFAIDIGGTGSRAGIWQDRSLVATFSGGGIKVGGAGANILDLATHLGRQAQDWLRAQQIPQTRIAGLGLGASGLTSFIADPSQLADDLARQWGCERVAVAADIVTAHLGALNGKAGSVVAVGTGCIALGTDYGDHWRRIDGLGHLLGDRGSGAWIGMKALRAAALHADGIETLSPAENSGAALHARAVEKFGPLASWPQQLYTNDNRAGVMAGFAQDVIELAEHDAWAAQIVRRAARHITATLMAASPQATNVLVSGVGGIMGSLVGKLVQEKLQAHPQQPQWQDPLGSPLDGAGWLARHAAQAPASLPKFAVKQRPPFIWLNANHPSLG